MLSLAGKPTHELGVVQSGTVGMGSNHVIGVGIVFPKSCDDY